MTLGIGLALLGGCGATAGGSGHTDNQRILIVPTEQSDFVREDIRLRLAIPAAFLREHNPEPQPPFKQVSFAIKLGGNTPTSVAPTDDPSVVVVSLSVVYHDAIDAALNKRNTRYSGGYDWVWENVPRSLYNLRYATNTQYPGAPLEEVLFEDRKPFYLQIHCQPSGNTYPSLCVLSTVGERGGGVNPTANAAVMTEITFRHDRLSDWQTISQQINAFLHDRLTVQRWEK